MWSPAQVFLGLPDPAKLVSIPILTGVGAKKVRASGFRTRLCPWDSVCNHSVLQELVPKPLQDGQDYVHRIGRTGRAGRKGNAITLLAKRPSLVRDFGSKPLVGIKSAVRGSDLNETYGRHPLKALSTWEAPMGRELKKLKRACGRHGVIRFQPSF